MKKRKDDDEDEKDEKVKKKGKKKKRKPAKKFFYEAPENFKPFFAHLFVQTGKDGLIQTVDVVRFKGRPDNPKAKQVKLSETDPETLASVAARLAGPTYKPNIAKRLPTNTSFRMLVRVGASDDNLRFGVKEILAKKGSKKKRLGKKHPWWRLLRKCSRTMPAAFMDIGEFPKFKKEKEEKGKKGKKSKDDDE